MAATVEIPSFDFSAFYYAQILEALIQYKRTHVPELTNESTEEPLIQMLRAFALVGHLNNVLIDLTANESTLPTAKLSETIRNMLRLIDYELDPASPSQADVVFKMVQIFAAVTQIIPQYAQVATEREGTVAGIPFEFLSAVSVERTDQIGSCLAYDAGTTTYTDYTAKANSAPGDDFTPWGTPIQNNDALLIGHESIEWDKLKAELDTVGTNFNGVWEYYDGDTLDAKPDTMERISATLRFTVNSVLGTANRIGATVRVQLDSSGAFEDCVSQWGDIGAGNVNYIVTTALLGQSVSEADATDENDYTVGSLWKELPGVVDGTDSGGVPLGQAGDLEYTLPESVTDRWQKVTIEGVEAYWMRLRITVNLGAATSPVVDRLRIDTGNQYLKATAVQGQRQVDSPLGTADGSADQRFSMSKEYFIWDSQVVTVATVEWSRVDNFLQSKPTDRHYVIELGENDRADIVFGDGTRGEKPSGAVAADYRHGAQQDGNVGASTIVVDNSGIPFTSDRWNPRSAIGWQESQAADEESLELAKIQGPASLRIVNVALGPDDVETLTLEYADSTGAKPFARSRVIEEGFGPKTMENVVVAAGGGAASSTQLDDLDEYFNGDRFASPPATKKVVANQEVTSTNYGQKTINITADVYGAASAAVVQDFLSALLQPETKKADGVTFEWVFGEDVEPSRISHEIFESDEDIWKVENLLLNGGAGAVALSTRELPVAGTITITVYP